MADTFESFAAALDSPARNAAAVTPGATALTNVARALYVGTSGDVEVTMKGGGDVVFNSVPAGFVLPVVVTHVLSGSTTASNIVALW